MDRKFGWRPSLPDFRDFRYRAISPDKEVAQLPPVKYLICPPVVDQGDLGSCVFFALSYAMESAQVSQDIIPENPSQLFAYYHYRETYGQIDYDDGAMIRDAVKLLAADGICGEEDWPYLTANFAVKPPFQSYIKAREHRIQSYHALETMEDMLNCIADGYGFVCGISVYSSIDDAVVVKTGKVPVPGKDDKFLGGHAIYVGGYNLHKQMFKFQNSWGKDWGDQGFGWIPFAYLESNGLCGDRWTVRR